MKILGLSGKKQSGKSTAANFLLGVYMRHLEIVRGQIHLQEHTGKLCISDLYGDTEQEGIIDYENPPSDQFYDYMDACIHPFFKIYSFADLLKQLCINVLGLSKEQCYGTNEEKDSLTHLKWENMPGVITYSQLLQFPISRNITEKEIQSMLGVVVHDPGQMTGREVLQYVGSDIFRKIYSDVWVRALKLILSKEQPELAVITDCRFPNEVEGIQDKGGKVIRFLRNPSEDEHQSETQLGGYDKFDAVIDNRELDQYATSELVYQQLREWDFIPELQASKKVSSPNIISLKRWNY